MFCMLTNVVTELGGIGNGVAFFKTVLYKRKWYIILIFNLMSDDQACVIKLLDYLNCVLVLWLLTCFCMITNVVTEFGGIGN